MPKAKPTHVIVHRIELQEKERELIEPFVKAKEVEQYGKTLATMVGAGALGVGVYVAWWTCDALFGWMGTAKDKIDAFKEQVKEYDEQTDGATSDAIKHSSPAGRVILTILGL